MSDSQKKAEENPVSSAIMENQATPPAEGDKPAAAPGEETKQVPNERLSKSWEKIAKLEAKQREEAAKFKAEREAFEKQQAEIKKQAEELSEKDRLLKEDPVAWFEKYAPPKTYEHLTKRYLNQGKPSPEEKETKLIERLAALEARLEKEKEEKKRQEEEVSMKAVQEQANKYREELKAELGRVEESEGEEPKPVYELIRAFDADSEVENLVVLWANRKGELLTPQKAADMIEKELENQLPQLLKTRKLSALLNKPKEEPAKDGKAKSHGSPKTLTNDLTAASPAQSRQHKTREELIEELAAKIDASKR